MTAATGAGAADLRDGAGVWGGAGSGGGAAETIWGLRWDPLPLGLGCKCHAERSTGSSPRPSARTGHAGVTPCFTIQRRRGKAAKVTGVQAWFEGRAVCPGPSETAPLCRVNTSFSAGQGARAEGVPPDLPRPPSGCLPGNFPWPWFSHLPARDGDLVLSKLSATPPRLPGGTEPSVSPGVDGRCRVAQSSRGTARPSWEGWWAGTCSSRIMLLAQL